MVKKRCIRKPQPNTDLTSVKNDLVLSADRHRIYLESNRIGSLDKQVAESLVTVENDQTEEKSIHGKIDRARDSDVIDDEECHRNINQDVTCEYSEYSVDGNEDELVSISVNNEKARTGESLSHSTSFCWSPSSFNSDYSAKSLLDNSNVNTGNTAAQETPAQAQSCTVFNQGSDSGLCGRTFNQYNTFNPEVGRKLSDKAEWLSPDNACHVDRVLDQLFEESVKEKLDIINNSVHLPQNMHHVSENENSEHMCQDKEKLGVTMESFTSDLQPSIRERNFTISYSTHVKSRNQKPDGHNIKRPVLCAVTRGGYSEMLVKTPTCCDNDTYDSMCRRKGQNNLLYKKQEDVPTYLVNHTMDTGSVGDLQPSVRVRKLSSGQHTESTLQMSSADRNRNEWKSDEDQMRHAEKCSGLKETDTNTAEIVYNEERAEYDRLENVCNERLSSESLQGMVKRKNKSLTMQGQNVICGSLVGNINAQESIEVSDRRRVSKSLEESDCHGNSCREYQEQIYLKRDKDETNLKSKTALSNNCLKLKHRKNATHSVENLSESHRHKISDSSVLSETETKRKRFNSGPDSSRKRSKNATGAFVLDTTDNFSIKASFASRRNRTKSKSKHKNEIRVGKDKTEQTVIHDIHRTIAESSNVGSKFTDNELNETDDSETVRVTDLENIIPLDVLSCDNVGKRKVRLKHEKAKGALYRQVSSDGIWRSVNSKY